MQNYRALGICNCQRGKKLKSKNRKSNWNSGQRTKNWPKKMQMQFLQKKTVRKLEKLQHKTKSQLLKTETLLKRSTWYANKRVCNGNRKMKIVCNIFMNFLNSWQDICMHDAHSHKWCPFILFCLFSFFLDYSFRI